MVIELDSAGIPPAEFLVTQSGLYVMSEPTFSSRLSGSSAPGISMQYFTPPMSSGK